MTNLVVICNIPLETISLLVTQIQIALALLKGGVLCTVCCRCTPQAWNSSVTTQKHQNPQQEGKTIHHSTALFVHKTCTQGGGCMDFLTPSLSTKEGPWPQLKASRKEYFPRAS